MQYKPEVFTKHTGMIISMGEINEALVVCFPGYHVLAVPEDHQEENMKMQVFNSPDLTDITVKELYDKVNSTIENLKKTSDESRRQQY